MLICKQPFEEELKIFEAVEFNPEDHTYFLEGQELKSVTRFIKEFSAEFDGKRLSEKVALKEGLTPRMVLDKWAIKRDYAAVRGSEFHLYAEMFINYNRALPILTNIKNQTTEFVKFIGVTRQTYDVVATELIVADKELGIAGTVDCLMRHKDTGHYLIFDWKTNDEIKYDNPWDKMKTPLNHFPSCAFYDYSLQLAIYKRLIERNTEHLKLDTGVLVHFPPRGEYKIIKPHTMDEEVGKILKAA